MQPCEITWPGTWIAFDGVDPIEFAGKPELQTQYGARFLNIKSLLGHLEEVLFSGALAVHLFAEAQTAQKACVRAHFKSIGQADPRHEEIREEVEQELSDEGPEAIDFETEIRIKRESWAAGVGPEAYVMALPSLYAQSFLHSADLFGKFLKVLSAENDAPPKIAGLHDEFLKTFPELTEVRNTNEHLEDRARRLGKRGKGGKHQPLLVQPMKPGGPIVGAALMLGSLIGTKFGNTMADGHFGEVDVSPASVEHMQRILQGVLDAFQWVGPRSHAPS